MIMSRIFKENIRTWSDIIELADLAFFTRHWGAVLSVTYHDKLNSSNLYFLLCRALNMCLINKVQFQSIAMDGTSFNFNATELFGGTEDANTCTCYYSAFEYITYFFADPPYTFKLIFETLAELKKIY